MAARRSGTQFSQATPEIPGDLIYDPDQDPEEKRRVRKEYRNLNKDTEGKLNPADFTTQQLAAKVKRADELFENVKGPQEATLDSSFLLMASNLGAIKARAMKSGSGAFDVDDFVTKLITFMGGRGVLDDAGNDSDDADQDDEDDNGPLDWAKFGRFAMTKSRRAPAIDFMLGPLSVEIKKRAVVKRAKLEKNERDHAKPQELNEEDIVRSENETTKNVITLQKILEENGEVNLFQFIVNPHDFGQSVENMFYLSFLIRDGICAMEIKEDGNPIIYLCEAPDESDYREGIKKQQAVMQFDEDTWRFAIETYDIREPMVPTRPPPADRFGGQWVG